MWDLIGYGMALKTAWTLKDIDFTKAFEDSKLLDNIVDTFRMYGLNGTAALTDVAIYICLLLMAIEFATDWALYDGNVRISKFINDIVKSAFFLFIIINWSFFVYAIEHFFIQVGLLAGDGGSTAITASDILNQGFKICADLFEGLLKALGVDTEGTAKAASSASTATANAGNAGATAGSSAGTGASTGSSSSGSALSGVPILGDIADTVGEWWDKGKKALEQSLPGKLYKTGSAVVTAVVNTATGQVNLMQALCYLVAIFMVVLSHFWIALQIVLCKVEFYLFVALGTIFLPFGICKHTKFLFDRSIQGLVNFGVKLMGLYFLLAIAQGGLKMTTQPVIPADKSFDYYLQIGLLYLTIAFLIWVLPEKLGAIMSGSPSLSAKEAVATGFGAYAATKTVASIPGRVVSSAEETISDIRQTWRRTEGDWVEVPEVRQTGNYILEEKDGVVRYVPETYETGRTVYQYKTDEELGQETAGFGTRVKRYAFFQAQQGLLGSILAPWVRGGASARRRDENWGHFMNGDYGSVRYDYKQ